MPLLPVGLQFSVWKAGAQSAVGPGPRERAQNGYEHHRNSRPDERNKRARTASGQRPSHAERRAPRKIAHTAAERLRLEAERLAIRPAKTQPLNHHERDGGGHYRG